jgi:hypothetical protein
METRQIYISEVVRRDEGGQVRYFPEYAGEVVKMRLSWEGLQTVTKIETYAFVIGLGNWPDYQWIDVHFYMSPGQAIRIHTTADEIKLDLLVSVLVRPNPDLSGL